MNRARLPINPVEGFARNGNCRRAVTGKGGKPLKESRGGQAIEMTAPCQRCQMTLGTILLIVLIILLIGALPTWPYSSGWGYYPSGGAGLLVIVLIILLLVGRL
jgi:hypothetical protein